MAKKASGKKAVRSLGLATSSAEGAVRLAKQASPSIPEPGSSPAFAPGHENMAEGTGDESVPVVPVDQESNAHAPGLSDTTPNEAAADGSIPVVAVDPAANAGQPGLSPTKMAQSIPTKPVDPNGSKSKSPQPKPAMGQGSQTESIPTKPVNPSANVPRGKLSDKNMAGASQSSPFPAPGASKLSDGGAHVGKPNMGEGSQTEEVPAVGAAPTYPKNSPTVLRANLSHGFEVSPRLAAMHARMQGKKKAFAEEQSEVDQAERQAHAWDAGFTASESGKALPIAKLAYQKVDIGCMAEFTQGFEAHVAEQKKIAQSGWIETDGVFLLEDGSGLSAVVVGEAGEFEWQVMGSTDGTAVEDVGLEPTLDEAKAKAEESLKANGGVGKQAQSPNGNDTPGTRHPDEPGTRPVSGEPIDGTGMPDLHGALEPEAKMDDVHEASMAEVAHVATKVAVGGDLNNMGLGHKVKLSPTDYGKYFEQKEAASHLLADYQHCLVAHGLSKEAVDEATKDYYDNYYGAYGKQLTKDVALKGPAPAKMSHTAQSTGAMEELVAMIEKDIKEEKFSDAQKKIDQVKEMMASMPRRESFLKRAQAMVLEGEEYNDLLKDIKDVFNAFDSMYLKLCKFADKYAKAGDQNRADAVNYMIDEVQSFRSEFEAKKVYQTFNKTANKTAQENESDRVYDGMQLKFNRTIRLFGHEFHWYENQTTGKGYYCVDDGEDFNGPYESSEEAKEDMKNTVSHFGMTAKSRSRVAQLIFTTKSAMELTSQEFAETIAVLDESEHPGAKEAAAQLRVSLHALQAATTAMGEHAAKTAASMEEFKAATGAEFTWEDEQEPGHPWMDEDEKKEVESGELKTYTCFIKDKDGNSLDVLGNCTVYAESELKPAFEADMMAEAKAQWEASHGAGVTGTVEAGKHAVLKRQATTYRKKAYNENGQFPPNGNATFGDTTKVNPVQQPVARVVQAAFEVTGTALHGDRNEIEIQYDPELNATCSELQMKHHIKSFTQKLGEAMSKNWGVIADVQVMSLDTKKAQAVVTFRALKGNSPFVPKVRTAGAGE